MTETISERKKEIRRLQQNLSAIRKIAGWTAETLGEKIGVTKQTISNLENQKSPMNFTQYIAIRTVLDVEIESNPENEVLPKVVKLLLDSGDELDSESYAKVQDVAKTVAATAADSKSSNQTDKIFDILIKSLPFIGFVVANLSATSSTNWTKKLFK